MYNHKYIIYIHIFISSCCVLYGFFPYLSNLYVCMYKGVQCVQYIKIYIYTYIFT